MPPDEQYAINDFKSTIEVDIDEKLVTLKEAHIAIHNCLTEIVTAADFDGNSVQIKTKEEPHE